jgi:hypothetical protein
VEHEDHELHAALADIALRDILKKTPEHFFSFEVLAGINMKIMQ